ncbi:MAG TPA: Uma2 family endonuclease [Herpetosiphonaceae bacterium]
MATAIEQRIFSVADYHRMAEVGILTEADRVELIEGRLIVISPVGSCHAACIKRLNAALSRQTSGHALGSIQDPLQLDDYSEPEPDVALLRPRDDFYATSHPTAEDVLLLIEVADTSEGYDHEEKVPLYARSNIPEVWFVSLAKKRVEVYTEPVAEIYRQVRYVLAGETLTVQQIPNVQLAADDLFG